MSVIIAIAVFVLSSFVLAFPHLNTVSKERYTLVDAQNEFDLQIFQQLSEDDLAILRTTTCRVTRNAMQCDETIDLSEPFIFQITHLEQAIHLYVVFDMFDVLDPEATPNYHIDNEFTSLPPLTGIDRYLIVFYQNQVLYRTPKATYTELMYTNTEDFDFRFIDDGGLISYRMIDMLLPKIRQEITFYTFIATVIYPFLIVLVVWLLFKSSASTFSLKDFYNIAAIASIVPLIVIFSLSWIFPQFALMQYYSAVFGLYFLLMIFRITSRTHISS